ncbi:tetratricopeptide repeat protein [Pedobacter glucosidilyticus]|uniref:ATP-binding protein n=1 Tax=Pedobacter glucosidilyticus TaxID=1122941 RepID=UPI0004085046|nr:sensor histidine kinase [Pedobacter glucosidilyticus]
MINAYVKLFLTIVLSLCIYLIPINAQETDEVELRKKIDLLNEQARKKLLMPDSMIVYAEQAYQWSDKAGYAKGKANALKFKGIYAHAKSNFNQAIQYYQDALEIFTTLKDDLEIGKANLNIATSYNHKNEYPLSIQYGLEALKYFRKVNDPNGEGRVLNLLGIATYIQGDYRTALKYFFNYNHLVQKAKDENEIASSFNNIGSAYEKLKRPDSAIFYYKKVLAYEIKKGSESNLGMTYQNIGSLYNSINKHRLALDFHQKSKTSFERANDKKYLSHSYYNIGLSYKLLKDTTAAISWFKKAMNLASVIQETEILKETNQQLSKIDASDQNFKQAYQKLLVSNQMQDAILNSDKTKIIEELKTKYETEKKELKIADLNQQAQINQLQLKQKNSYLLFAIIVIALGILTAYLLFNRQKIKQQMRLKEDANKQQELMVKEILLAEERERRRIASDLHDGVGQTLSAALMNLHSLVSKINLQDKQQSLFAEKTLSLLNESYDEMRSISHQMVPNALIKSGLTTAVREFINKIDEQKLKISLETEGLDEKLDENIETAIYRIIQEAVNNVVKHAKASKLSIQIFKDTQGISLTIEDNGIGFNVKEVNQTSGIGLKNIQNRVHALKGNLEYDSRFGSGTLVNIYIPISP